VSYRISPATAELLLSISQKGIRLTNSADIQLAGNAEVILKSGKEFIVGVDSGTLYLIDIVDDQPFFISDATHWGELQGVWSHYFNLVAMTNSSDPLGPIWFEYDDPEICRFDGLSHAEAIRQDQLVMSAHKQIEPLPKQVHRQADKLSIQHH
jgi:hypothetical protein